MNSHAQQQASPPEAHRALPPASMTSYTSFAVFIFFAIALNVPSGFSFGAALLLVGSGSLLRKQVVSGADVEDRKMLGVLAAYFLLYNAMSLVHGAAPAEYDQPLRFLLAIPALLLLLAFPSRPGAIWAGLAIGAISAGVFADWQHFMQGEERSSGFTNPIQFGNISLLLGTLCLAGFDWARTQSRSTLWRFLLAAGAILGIFGAVLTGSRGSWVALPFTLVALYKHYAASLNRQQLALGTLVLVLGCGALYITPHNPVKDRIELAVSEADHYTDKNESSTSIGARLEMARTAVMLIRERPLLGWGKAGYRERVQVLIGEKQIAPVVGEHTHVHNEYLDAWMKRGIPGLLAVLILYLMPLRLFFLQYQRGSESARPYALAGVVLCISYFAYGLTQAFLTHNNGVMIYAFTLAILWSATRRNQVNQPSSSI